MARFVRRHDGFSQGVRTAPAIPGEYCGPKSTAHFVRAIMNIGCANPKLNSLIFAHEAGHGLFGLENEYGPAGGYCGHSIMNGPQNWTYRFCKPINHCYDGAPGSFIPAGKDCTAAGSNWWDLTNGYGSWIWSLPNLYVDSSQPWKRFDENIYADDHIAFTFE